MNNFFKTKGKGIHITPLSYPPKTNIYVHKFDGKKREAPLSGECHYCDQQVKQKTTQIFPAIIFEITRDPKVPHLENRYKGKQIPGRVRKQMRRLTKSKATFPLVYATCTRSTNQSTRKNNQ